MQIHELNTFGGDLDSSVYAVVDNGTDTGKVSIPNILQGVIEDIEAVDARVDNIITSPAPTEQEIIDARVGADGQTYSSLGDAIREQVDMLSGDIALANTGSESVRMLSPFVRGAMYNGEIQTYGLYRVVNQNLMTFTEATQLKIASGFWIQIAFFVDGNYSSSTSWTANLYNLPAGSTIRISIRRETEITSELADIAEFTGAVTILSDFGKAMDSIDASVKTKGGITASNYQSLGFSSVTDLPYDSVYGISYDITEDMITDLPVYGYYGQITKTSGLVPNDIYIVYEYTNSQRERYIAWQNNTNTALSAWTRISTGSGDGLTPVSARTLIDANSKVIFIGDSIVAGVGGTGWQQDHGRYLLTYNGVDLYANDDGTCWANMMRDYLEDNYGCTALNNGLSGFNSVNIPENISSLVPSDATHVIACWGINDRAYNYNTVAGYQTVIDYCDSIGAKIVPVTICPCNQANSLYSHTQYEIVTRIKTVCKNNNLEVCDLFSAVHDYFFITGNNFDTDYLPDNLHPNDAMYTIMFNLMRKLLGV